LTYIEETVVNTILSNLPVIGSFNALFTWNLHLEKWKGQLNITWQVKYQVKKGGLERVI